MADQLKFEIPVNTDIDSELWTDAKVHAVKRHILLKSWVTEALQEKIDRENNIQN